MAGKRAYLTHADKVKVRQQKHAQSPSLSQRELCTWFLRETSRQIGQSVLQRVLNPSQHEQQQEQEIIRKGLEINAAAKRLSKCQWPALERCLYSWILQHQSV